MKMPVIHAIGMRNKLNLGTAKGHVYKLPDGRPVTVRRTNSVSMYEHYFCLGTAIGSHDIPEEKDGVLGGRAGAFTEHCRGVSKGAP